MASNGRLDVSTLTRVAVTNGSFGYLENSTAQGWFAARADLIRTTGIAPVLIQDGLYRDYARQVYWKTYWTRLGRPENAATPGTSNHGFGTAVDINNISAYNQATLDAVMARHGFVRDTSESWHYHHTSINPSDVNSTPIESEEMPITDADAQVIVKTQIILPAPWGQGTVAEVLAGTRSRVEDIYTMVSSIASTVASINAKVTAQGNAAPGSFSAADRAMLDDIANKAELSSALTNTVNLVNSHADANKAQIIQEIDTHGGSSLSAFTATITPVE